MGLPANLSSNVLDRIFNQTQAICVQANNRTRGKVIRRFGAQEVQDQGEEEQPQIAQLSFKRFPNNFKQLFAFPHKFCQFHRGDGSHLLEFFSTRLLTLKGGLATW